MTQADLFGPGGVTHALTLWEPWAHAILYLGKDVENRPWATKFRGRIAIHASVRKPKMEDVRSVLALAGRSIEADGMPIFHLGCIVGTVEVVGCIRNSSSPWAFRDGRSHHILVHDPRPLEKPIPVRGALGLWKLPEGWENGIDPSWNAWSGRGRRVDNEDQS